MANRDRLTDIRHAMWDAIDNYSYLTNAFQQKYKFDGETAYINPDTFVPEISSVPAIAIWPPGGSLNWFTNSKQKGEQRFEIIIWTPGWELASESSTPEQLMMLVLSALWVSGPSSETDPNQSYIKQASCSFVKGVSYRFDRAKTGDGNSNELTRTTIGVTLEYTINPRTIATT